MRELKFTVFCHPEPQGSTRAFIPKGWKRPIITSANPKMKPYRQLVTQTILESLSANAIQSPWAGKHVPVALRLDFYFAKPPSCPRKRTEHVVRPDCDKIIRAAGDAMTGVIYFDDAQVVEIHARKFYGTPERVEITCTKD